MRRYEKKYRKNISAMKNEKSNADNLLANPPTNYDVAIIGYGPTGATLANLLAMSGLQVVVLERESSLYHLPRAVHFDDEVMRIFQTVGIADALKEKVRVNLGMRFLDSKGKLILDWPRPQEVGPNAWHASYRFHQPDLEKLLRESLEQYKNATVLSRVDVFSLIDQNNTVQISYEDRSNGDIHHLSSKYVVGCDGARSIVRRFIGHKMKDLGFKERWLVVDVLLKHPMPELGDHSIQYCNPQRPMTYCRSPEERRRWEITIHENEDANEVCQPNSVWKFLKPWLNSDDAELERSAVYTFRSDIAEQWRKGRLLIAGDAAHLTPPFMGQGMCAGIRDASNLAWKLALCVSDKASNAEVSDNILDSYQSERAPHVHEYITTAIRLGHLINNMNQAATNELSQNKNDEGSKKMHSIVPRLGKGLSVGHTEHTGTLFPQPMINDSLFDDTYGYSFVLLSRQSLEHKWKHKKDELHTTQLKLLCAENSSVLIECLDKLKANAILIRPDKYIVGTANTNSEIDSLLSYQCTSHFN